MSKIAWAAVCALSWVAVDGCMNGGDDDGDVAGISSALVSANVDVTANESTEPGSLNNGSQAEQSIVRVVRAGAARGFVVGSNDYTNMVDPTTGLVVANPGIMGISRLPTDVSSWQPSPQFALPSGPPAVVALNGDPWLATDASHTVV